jgi:nitrate reductase gamma subunit
MSGIAWCVSSFAAAAVSALVIAYRTWALSKLPLHLRWELAPVPHEKGKARYGGSYLEEYEWWSKPWRTSLASQLMYMGKEILWLRGVWQHNRGLWPLAFSLHVGIYLTGGMLLLLLVYALLSLVPSPPHILHAFLRVASLFAPAGYLLGGVGATGLVLKRAFDHNLRPFNTVSRYANLLFLAAVFASGAYAWLGLGDSTPALGRFVIGLITFDSGVNVPSPLAAHIVISLLFILYLPLTDMVHFVAKFFMFHQVRWDDEPQGTGMEKELSLLLAQPVTWSASHVGADGQKDWTDVVNTQMSDEEQA